MNALYRMRVWTSYGEKVSEWIVAAWDLDETTARVLRHAWTLGCWVEVTRARDIKREAVA